MPRPPEDLDIWAAIQYLLQRVQALTGGSDAAHRATVATTAPTVSTSQAVGSGAGGSDNPITTVPIPSISISAVVIPP